MNGLILNIFSDSKEVVEHLKILSLPQLKGKGQARTFVVKNSNEVEAAINDFSLQPLSTTELVIYSFENKDLEPILRNSCRFNKLPCLNAFEPALSALRLVFESPPEYRLKIWEDFSRQYMQRFLAIEFALEHDDGKHPEGWREADCIILGVSRTSKTPISIYLANEGLKVANVPIIYNVPLPAMLYEQPVRKLVGLDITLTRLLKVRRERASNSNFSGTYLTEEGVRKELEYARKIYQDIGCSVIDVSSKAVEEAADEILKILEKEGLYGKTDFRL